MVDFGRSQVLFEYRTIWKPDICVRFTSLDRFINKANIFFAIKRSRLADILLKTGHKYPVFKWLLQNGCLLPFKNRISKVSEKWPFEYWTVRYSVGHCIQEWHSPNSSSKVFSAIKNFPWKMNPSLYFTRTARIHLNAKILGIWYSDA
jgi:hypothetical protein